MWQRANILAQDATHILLLFLCFIRFHVPWTRKTRRERQSANGSGSGRKKPKPTNWLSQLAVSRSFSVGNHNTSQLPIGPDGLLQSSPDKRDISELPRLIHGLNDPRSRVRSESQYANHTLTGLVESEVFYLLLSLLSL